MLNKGRKEYGMEPTPGCQSRRSSRTRWKSQAGICKWISTDGGGQATREKAQEKYKGRPAQDSNPREKSEEKPTIVDGNTATIESQKIVVSLT